MNKEYIIPIIFIILMGLFIIVVLIENPLNTRSSVCDLGNASVVGDYKILSSSFQDKFNNDNCLVQDCVACLEYYKNDTSMLCCMVNGL